jgi:DNA invertase Pin-like site-specific DNA recombinase
MKLDLYARVSTEEQDVQQQMDYLRSWCRLQHHQIVNEVYDEESGTIPIEKREKFLGLLNKPKGEALLVYNLDRLTRNWDSVVFIEKFFRENWIKYKLISMSDEINLSNASGRAMFRMKMIMNCYMPEDMREKQVIGIDRAKREGKFKGRKKGSVNK